MATTNRPSVFISYTHDSPEHERRVLELCHRLIQDGADAHLDQHVEHKGPHWQKWSDQQLRAADLVLVICTPEYRKVFHGEAPAGVRHGSKSEANWISNYLYQAGGENGKCLPVLLDGASSVDIPDPLVGWPHYSPTDQAGYDKLWRRIAGQPGIEPPAPGELRYLPPEDIDLPPLPDHAAEQQAAAYLERLRQEVGHIKIGSIDRNTTQAVSFAIGDVYIPLCIRAAAGRETPDAERGRRRIESALKHRKLIVQGDAGSGKSTFLKCVAFDLSLPQGGGTPLELEERGFPLYVRVPELDAHLTKTWNRDANDTKDSPTRETDPRWIPHFLAMLDWGASRSFFESKLRRENTLLLLDGLDEAPGDNSRERMAKLLDETARQYPKCRIVVATRPQALTGEARPVGFEEVWIDEFDDDSIKLFVERWCACRYPGEPERAERERSRLSEALEKGEIPQLAKNPLMLAALTVIHFNGGRLPDDRLELYDAILHWLARSRERLPGQPHWEIRLERLMLIALGMQTRAGGRVRQIALDEAAAFLSPLMTERDALRCLRVEEADSGILAARGDSVEFPHLTFQEYLAARALADRAEADLYNVLWEEKRLFSPEWREVMVFFAAAIRKFGSARPNRLFNDVIARTGPSVAERARTVALLTLLRDALRRRDSDGNVTEFLISDPRYLEFVREMIRLFEDPAAGAGLDARTRADAAEAWERLGNMSRLRLPSHPSYWVACGRFMMARYPVTVGEYAEFITAGGHEPRRWDSQRMWPYRPVVYVSWHEAVGYCEWATRNYERGRLRLPTSEEWESVAAGENRREYPWGNEDPDDARSNFEMRVGRVTPVGLFPAGNTPDGVADLAGNMWEWSASEDQERQGAMILRGGAFGDVAGVLRAAFRDWARA